MRSRSLYIIICILFVSFALVLLQPPGVALADGTETLGPASIPIASGTGMVASGVGLEGVLTPTLNLDVPTNATVEQVIIYWSGGAVGAGNAGDNTLKVNGIEVTGPLIGGPTYFFTRNGNNYYFSTYRADITNLGVVVPGTNTITITDVNFSPDENNGAGIMAIIDDGSPTADIQLRDGIDLAFINFPAPRDTTVLQTINFAPATINRIATLPMFFGSVQHTGTLRASTIEINVDGTVYRFHDLLNSHDGQEWDSPIISAPIPAGVTSFTVQAFSRDDDASGQLPASLSWLASAIVLQPVPPVSVGDFVWHDSNGNGVQDVSETGVPTVTVRIFTASGQPAVDMDGHAVPPQITDNAGLYLFTNLPPGSYYVVFDLSTLPPNYQVTKRDAGSDDTKDSDADPATGQTAPTPVLAAGEVDRTLDMGILQLQGVRVGDYVWQDENINGQQDPGEPGVPAITVTLFAASNDQQLGVTQTDADGFYLFDDLPPGQYYVVFDLMTLPLNFSVTTQNAGGVPDDLDSDANPASGRSDNSRTLTNGEEDLTLDMGIFTLARLSLGNLVWIDTAGGVVTSTLFNNGRVDPGEPGLASVPITLTNVSGTVLMTTTTDANGNYRFNGLLPDEYMLTITVPVSYTSSTGGGPPPLSDTGPNEPAPDPDDNVDDDDNGTASTNPQVIYSFPISLTLGGEPAEGGNYNPTVDFGLLGPGQTAADKAAIGDFVWREPRPPVGQDNCDGIQDDNSIPVPNVVVRLYKASGALVGTQLTNANGFYLFTDLEPGPYYVEFDRPGGSPPPYYFAKSKQGTNIQRDSDAVSIAPDSLTARTETTELVADETDRSWDAGLCETPTDLPPTEEPDLSGPVYLPFVSR